MPFFKPHPFLPIIASADGRVLVPPGGMRRKVAKWTRGTLSQQGYYMVGVCGCTYYVHRLIAETFIGPIPKGMEVDHINRNRADNRLENIRIVTRSENHRNMPPHDRVTERGGTHYYEDEKQYRREHYSKNKDKLLEYNAHRYQARCKTHRQVLFPDGKQRWIPNSEAILLLAIPVKERH